MKLLVIVVLVCLAITMCKGVPIVQSTSAGSKPLQCSDTDFSIWKNSKGWKTAADDCCKWAGVHCESSSGSGSGSGSGSDSDHDKKDKDPKGHHHHRHVLSMSVFLLTIS